MTHSIKSKLVCFFIQLLLMICFSAEVRADLYMSVSGHVVDAESNKGIENVTIELMSKTKGKVAEAISASNGFYKLKNIKKGNYDLLAYPTGNYFMNSKELIPVVVNTGKNVVGTKISLNQGGIIKGRVLTNTGIEVANATILGNDGTKTTTDENGNFILKGVESGEVHIGILPSAIGIKMVTTTVEAKKINELGNIIIDIGEDSTVKGKVNDVSGNSLSGAIVVFFDKNEHSGYTIVDENGSYAITGLEKGNYNAFVVRPGYEELRLENITVPASELNFTLTPSPVQSASILRYRIEEKVSGLKIISKVLELVSPNDAFAASYKECPGDFWVGASFDLSVVLPASLIARGKVSVSIGSRFCFWSPKSSLVYLSTCIAGGTGTDIIGIDLTLNGTVAWSACAADRILKTSSNTVYDIALGKIQYATFSAGGNSLSAGGSIVPTGITALLNLKGIFKNLKVSGFVGYQKCEFKELFPTRY